MYGHTHHRKQRYRRKDCQRQFVSRNDHWIDERTRTYIEQLLRERISLRAICRAMQVSMTWLMNFAASIWEQTPADLGVNYELLDNLTEEELRGVELELDEMWSLWSGNKISGGSG
ncbi:hypothetical protein LEM8419_00386 [Neolewinella maritima]|uniref:Transposase n=1 Tax=Neolewinella maritima TaxID=1383882 RepID=A0ABN8F2W8_9BACT|nr:hypothetical protein [Neolewinella maritima]CAH0999091.1 hypothetical protein LEM8419_00386 [Neolewinella maritima]